MEKVNIIKQIQIELSKIVFDGQETMLSVENDLETVLMYGNENITHIDTSSITTATIQGGEEIDWNDYDFDMLDDDTLFEILSSIEYYNIQNDKTLDRISSYNY